MGKIRAAIEDAERNYCGDEDLFVLTDEGRKLTIIAPTAVQRWKEKRNERDTF